MTASLSRLPTSIARAAAACVAALTLASCGGGGVSANPSPIVDSPTLTILPATAVMYSGLPTTFVLSGGTGAYIIASSDQAVLPISGGVTGRSVTLVPSPVSADTDVTLMVRDTGSATPVSAAVKVKPGTVSNAITITPSSTQSAACGSSICSGGDAEVKVTISQGGIPLAARGVRFDVVSGDFRIITSPPGVLEVTALSGLTTTDETGTARMRIRVLADATPQTALIQITDLGSGAYQRASFTVAPSSNAPLSAQPGTISFTGRDSDTCATGITADVIVFGGRPPYSISQPGTFTINPTTVSASGGRFSVSATGQCTTDTPIAIVDSNGASVSVVASNRVAAITVTTPALVVAPTSVSLDSCTVGATVTVAGGIGPPYFTSSGNGAVLATISGSTITIKRKPSTGPVLPTPPSSDVTVLVGVSDGRSVNTVTVNLIGAGAGLCP